MPYIQIAPSGAAAAGQAGAAYSQIVTPAVEGLSSAMLGVGALRQRQQALNQDKARDLAQDLYYREKLRLDEIAIGVRRRSDQASAARAEIEERTKLASQRAQLAEQARSLGYPVTAQGAAGLLEVLAQEDPAGLEMVTEMFPEGVSSEAEAVALWRVGADTLIRSREMRDQANKVGSAQRIAAAAQRGQGAGFWTEDDALELMALATDPNVSADEYAAQEQERETAAREAFRQRLAQETWGKRALEMFQGAKNLSGELLDKAIGILGDFESGKVDDPEAQALKMQALTAGTDDALTRMQEGAFQKGLQVGRSMPQPQPESFQFVQPGQTGAQPPQPFDFEALRNRQGGAQGSPAPDAAPQPTAILNAGSTLSRGFQPEAARTGADIRAAMLAQGLDPANRADFDAFMEGEARRWNEQMARLSGNESVPFN